MVEEQVKWIDGYEGLYLITSYGRVYSVVRRDRFSRISGGGEIIHGLTPKGYHFVTLYKQGKGIQFYVHQLVAKAFIPNPESKKCVDHLDNNKANNVVENLKWVTHLENMNNTITKMRMVNEADKYISQVGEDNPFSRKVAVYNLDGELIGIYGSGGQAKRELGLPSNVDIGRVCRGERPQTHGYVFKYLSKQKMKINARPDNTRWKKPVIQFDLSDNVVAEYESVQSAARKTGFDAPGIGRAANGTQKTCGGYKWRFK